MPNSERLVKETNSSPSSIGPERVRCPGVSGVVLIRGMKRTEFNSLNVQIIL
jgi:hypothetical protein